jgi:outer membrane immunogenic protein
MTVITRNFAAGLLSFSLCLLSFDGASAADVAAPVYKAPPAPSWTGFYAGGHFGYGWAENRAVSFTPNDPATAVIALNAVPSSSPGSLDLSGLQVGLQAGYNWQLDSRWVVGVEADIALGRLEDTTSAPFLHLGIIPFSSTATEEVKWFGTVRGRLGYLVNDNLLLFASGGLAYGSVERNAQIANNSGTFAGVGIAPAFGCPTFSTCFAGSSRDTDFGWTAGGGFEYALDSRWRLKADYLYVNLGSSTYNIVAVTNNQASFTVRSDDVDFHVARIGVNYRF